MLTLPGDGILTPRIYDAFDTNTILAMVDSYDMFGPGTAFMELALRDLPFPFAVPWRELVLWVNGTRFASDPVGAVTAAVAALSTEQLDARLAAMERYWPQVSYLAEGSLVSRNILEGAYRLSGWQ